jgi:hypothetical protein
MEVGQPTGCDPTEPSLCFDLADGDVCTAAWIWERVDEDACLLVLAWSGSDDLPIWLATEAIAGREPEALAGVEAARRVLGLRTTEAHL